MKRSLFRRRKERGAALVEAGVLFLPLCIIVFGIIEYGVLFKDSLTLSSATRSGVRTGAAATGTSAPVFFPAVVDSVGSASTAATFTAEDRLWIYEADAKGEPIGDKSCGGGNGSATCVVYRYSTSGKWEHIGSFAWDPASAATCLGDGPLDNVGVRLTQHHSSITGLFPFIDDLVLSERSVMTFEPTSSTTTGCKT